MAARPRWLRHHPMPAASSGAGQVLWAERHQPSTALTSCLWPTEASVLAAMAAIHHRAVLASRHLSPEAEEGAGVESHCLHPAFVPKMPSVTVHLSLRLQLTSPPLPATWLQCPGISVGCVHVCLSLKTITTVLSPANTRLVTCAAIQSASLIKTVAHPSSH